MSDLIDEEEESRMREQKQPEQRTRLPQNNLIVFGASLAAACLMFAVLFVIILLMGKVGIGIALAWAGGAALITMAIVAITGLAFFRLPSGSSFRRGEE